MNWKENDYWLGNVCEVSEDEAARNIQRAKQLSLSLLYWLQTEAPRPDGGAGWPGLRLRKDIVGTEDGLAKYPYIREGRRIKAEFTILEQHVGTEARMKLTGKSREEVTAEPFPIRWEWAATASISTPPPEGPTTSISARYRIGSRWEP